MVSSIAFRIIIYSSFLFFILTKKKGNVMKKLENVLIEVLNALFNTYGKTKGLKILKELINYIKL